MVIGNTPLFIDCKEIISTLKYIASTRFTLFESPSKTTLISPFERYFTLNKWLGYLAPIHAFYAVDTSMNFATPVA